MVDEPIITRKKVREAAEQLASVAWERREIPGELERMAEIRELTKEQLKQDVYSVTGSGLDRVGREYVSHYNRYDDVDNDETDDPYPFWPDRSDDQLALEKGLEPFLDRLPAEIRPILRLTYDQGMSVREIENETGITKSTVNRRLNEAHGLIRTMIAEAFPEEEVTDDGPGAI